MARRDDLLAEVGLGGLVAEGARERVAVEEVDAHRGEIDAALGAVLRRDGALEAAERLAGGLLVELRDDAVGVGLEDAKARRLVGRDRDRGDRQLGARGAVVRLERVEVHSVELVAGEDEHAAVRVRLDVRQHLPDGVGGALKPVLRVGGLLGGQDGHEAAREAVEAVRLRDVAVEARRVVLREHEDAPEVRVDAVRDRDVDEAVLARERDGGLGAVLGERVEPRPGAAAEDDREGISHGRLGG